MNWISTENKLPDEDIIVAIAETDCGKIKLGSWNGNLWTIQPFKADWFRTRSDEKTVFLWKYV